MFFYLNAFPFYNISMDDHVAGGHGIGRCATTAGYSFKTCEG
jgi:hypothetical protein